MSAPVSFASGRNSDGSLGGLIVDRSIVRPAILREIDFDVVMSIPVAEVLISWLQERVYEIICRTTSPEQPSGDGEPK